MKRKIIQLRRIRSSAAPNNDQASLTLELKVVDVPTGATCDVKWFNGRTNHEIQRATTTSEDGSPLEEQEATKEGTVESEEDGKLSRFTLQNEPKETGIYKAVVTVNAEDATRPVEKYEMKVLVKPQKKSAIAEGTDEEERPDTLEGREEVAQEAERAEQIAEQVAEAQGLIESLADMVDTQDEEGNWVVSHAYYTYELIDFQHPSHSSMQLPTL